MQQIYQSVKRGQTPLPNCTRLPRLVRKQAILRGAPHSLRRVAVDATRSAQGTRPQRSITQGLLFRPVRRSKFNRNAGVNLRHKTTSTCAHTSVHSGDTTPNILRKVGVKPTRSIRQGTLATAVNSIGVKRRCLIDGTKPHRPARTQAVAQGDHILLPIVGVSAKGSI